MANAIRFKRGTAVPTASLFAEGEPAWDKSNKKLYVKAGDGTMAEIGANATVAAGDKGDIVVDASGNWTLDSSVCTTAGRALIDDADAAAQRTTLGVASYALTLALC